MNKKKILITSAGTATSWHICQIIKQYYGDVFEIHLCDINPRDLVAASIYTEYFYQVPPIKSDGYKPYLSELMKKIGVEYIIPLIDFDLMEFPCDDDNLANLKILSTAPELKTTSTLSNKLNMNRFLIEHQIPTPKIFDKTQISKDNKYFIKPIMGYGSNGIAIRSAEELTNISIDGRLIQELCSGPEITAEVYNGDITKIFQRERIEIKAGVCTKMKPVNYKEINTIIYQLIECIKMPKAFCIQFMINQEGKWCVTDINLRLGAGTAMATAIGFQLTRAFLYHLLSGNDSKKDWFCVDSEITSVLRVYKEVTL